MKRHAKSKLEEPPTCGGKENRVYILGKAQWVRISRPEIVEGYLDLLFGHLVLLNGEPISVSNHRFAEPVPLHNDERSRTRSLSISKTVLHMRHNLVISRSPSADAFE